MCLVVRYRNSDTSEMDIQYNIDHVRLRPLSEISGETWTNMIPPILVSRQI